MASLPSSCALASAQELGNEAMSAVFQAVVEATEEALYNALLMATPVSSRAGRVNPLPVDSVRVLLRARGIGGAGGALPGSRR